MIIAPRDPQKIKYHNDLKDRIWPLILKDGHMMGDSAKYNTLALYVGMEWDH
jgi:hypothetical protein